MTPEVDVLPRTASPAPVVREFAPGLDTAVIARGPLQEVILTVRPLPGEGCTETFGRLRAALRARSATILKHTLFGAVSAYPEAAAALEAVCGPVDWPVTWVEGAPCGGGPLAGMQVWGVVGAPVETVRLDGRPIGRAFEDQYARTCYLADVLPDTPERPPAVQARQVFEKLEAGLNAAGMSLRHLVRTWLFMDDMLSWYRDLNAVRTAFFTEKSLFEGLIPASTGIGGRNRLNAAIVAEAFAMAGRGADVSVAEVPSPLQCPARAYGSTFSRAVEVSVAGVRRLLISGTASIASDGRTLHAGDMDAQVALTMRVVEALLESRGMAFADVVRAIAYVKQAADAPALARYCANRGLPPLPVVLVANDVCREDLLFEIEVDAARA